jgi:hypothetical protein
VARVVRSTRGYRMRSVLVMSQGLTVIGGPLRSAGPVG